MSFQSKIAPYLKFTPNERKGIIVLLVILLVVIILRVSIPYFKSIDHGQDVCFDQIEVKSSKKKYSQEYGKIIISKIQEEEKIRNTTLIIDPNIASFKTLVEIGFSEFGARNLIKYRKKGGYIFTSADLSRIYGVNPDFISEIEEQIIIMPREKGKESKQKFENIIVLEINTANTDTLQIIPCIGPVISERVIKYRSQLGGFVSLQQLEEVYGIDSNCYGNLLRHLVVDASIIQKLNLNTLDEKTLYMHPYISKYQARAIIKYRELIGPFTSISQLTENHIIIKSELQKLVDYLSL